MILSYPDPAVNQTPVKYSDVHNTFIRLVLVAGKRHDGQPWLHRLVAALNPVDDAAKLANLKRIERDLLEAK